MLSCHDREAITFGDKAYNCHQISLITTDMLMWIRVIIVTVLEGRKKGQNWHSGERSTVWHPECPWLAEKKSTGLQDWK